jgi:hypothetical protein
VGTPTARHRPRSPRARGLARAAGLSALVALAAALGGCTPTPAWRSGAPAPPAPPSASVSAGDEQPAGTPATPVRVSDGCRGLVRAPEAARGTGLPLAERPGDGAAAVAQYAAAVRAEGLSATVRLCAFADPAGDQLCVLALVFADSAQAGRMFASGQSAATLRTPQPVAGLGDAAVTDRSHTLLVRRGRGVLLVYLVRVAGPNADHTAALKAVATTALGRL